MATQIRLRRGTLVQTSAFTGANGEITFSYDTKSLHVHDGLTAGGIKLSKESELIAANSALTSLVNDRIQLANAAATYQTISNERAALANTNSYIATKLDSSSYTTADVQDKAQLANTNSYIASVDAQRASDLANTNSYISSINSTIVAPAITSVAGLPVLAVGITGAEVRSVIGAGTSSFDGDYSSLTNTPSIPSVSQYITVANAAVYAEVANVQSIAALSNTNAYIASVDSTRNANLANTNAYIATKLDSASYTTGDVQTKAALANTNSYIASVDSTRNANLANTNAYIATKLDSSSYTTSDVQTKAALANTNAYIATVDARIDTEVAAIVNSAPETLNTLNELAAALGDNPNFATTLTTNLGQKLGATASITLTGDITGSGSFSANAVSISLTDTNLANTNAYIATKLNAASYTTGDVQTKAALANTNSYIASVDTTRNSDLANTNAYIATKLDTASYTIGDVQTKAALANTNAYIATKLDSSAVSAFGGTLIDDADAATARTTLGLGTAATTAATDYATAAQGTTADNALPASSYTTSDVQSKAALANTNAYIATKLDTASYTTSDVQSKAALANTNAYIATKLDTASYTTGDVQTKAALANTNAYIATKLDTASYTTGDVQTKAALANTNAYIATKANTSSFTAFGFSLVDDVDAATARTTLGLGTAATTAATDYATAAQGSKADTAVQPGSLATVATSGNYSDLNNVLEVYNSAGTKIFP